MSIKSNNETLQIIDSSISSGFANYHFGELDIAAISDGDVLYDNNCFAPGVPRNSLQEVKKNKDEDSLHFILPHNILVIKSKNQVVLIDTGNGSKAGFGAGKLQTNLHAAGISPQDITNVVLSHAHPDHFNGLINECEQLVFPNAVIHMHHREFEFWQDNNADFSKSKNSQAFLHSLQQEIKTFLITIEKNLQLFYDDEPLFDFLQPILTPGHTPGHCIFIITSGTKKIVHISDIFHDEIVLFAKPEWGTIFDIDFELASRTRQEILQKYALSKQLLFGYHLPWPGFGFITKNNDKYTWMIDKNDCL